MTPSVAEYYTGKNIFLTGATGFMGKVLVEKLLRCCPDVGNIYMLMRTKRGQGPKERLEGFLNIKLFEQLHRDSPSSFDKLRVVPGDILAEELGIMPEDRQELQRETHIVIHCAACVRFDMPLRDAVNQNTVGTKRVLELADTMQKLEVFLHTSTSYCRCELDAFEEKVYPSKHKPQDVIECCSWMDEDLVNYMKPKLCDPQPNTYAYTKALTETLVSQYEGKFPIIIARPSIVTAAYKEPMPGWIDNLYGPTGIIIATTKGVLRTMMCDDAIPADVIPVDMAINACIVLAYTTALDKPKEIRVCNITQSGINALTWGAAITIATEFVTDYPSNVCLWYPGGSPKTSLIYHKICVFLFHILPAYFIDGILYLLGKKTFMIKVQKRIQSGLDVLQYYTMKPWIFNNENLLGLPARLNEEDKKTFYTDIKEIYWPDYLKAYLKGAREYCLKEDPSDLPKARRLIKQLYWLDIIVRCIFYFFVVYGLLKYAKFLSVVL